MPGGKLAAVHTRLAQRCAWRDWSETSQDTCAPLANLLQGAGHVGAHVAGAPALRRRRGGGLNFVYDGVGVHSRSMHASMSRITTGGEGRRLPVASLAAPRRAFSVARSGRRSVDPPIPALHARRRAGTHAGTLQECHSGVNIANTYSTTFALQHSRLRSPTYSILSKLLRGV